jgi:EAL domain-containing protein (putative c-di-GMP-specific phosphodiesterase class I)
VGKALEGVGRTMRPLGMVMFQMGERLRREIDSPLVGAPGDFTPTDFVGNVHSDNRGGILSSSTTAMKRKDFLARKSAEHTASTEVAVAIAAERDQAEKDRTMKEVIRSCLREGRINLLYQPIFDTTTNLPAKHEVYARLVLPDGEVLAPGQFLPIAEKFGLTLALDGVVLRRVMATHFGNGMVPSTQFALNVGGTSLDGITYLQELMSYGKNVLQHLVFEVRSQEIVRDARALKLLKDIQKHGGYLAVDYFGGGDAMLHASRAMGFDYVKLDASRFVINEDGKKELLKLCLTAKEIGLPVVLEKVEGSEIETFARKAGVTYLQGYGLAKPSAEISTAPLVRDAANTPQVATPSAPATAPAGA